MSSPRWMRRGTVCGVTFNRRTTAFGVSISSSSNAAGLSGSWAGARL
jgi:hypothetical protein